MRLELLSDDDATQVVVTYDDEFTLKVTKYGDGPSDYKYHNFEKIDDDVFADLLKAFCRSLLNL